jgi:hypothetical protein
MMDATLSAEEWEYLRRALSRAHPPAIETLLAVLNGRRSPAGSLSAEQLFEIIEANSSIADGQSENPSTDSVDDSQQSPSREPMESAYSRSQKAQTLAKKERELSALERRAETDYLIGELAKRLSAIASPKIKYYEIVSSKTQGELQMLVTAKIHEGWQPLGGVSAAAFGISPIGGNQYIQAMVMLA